MSWRNMFEVWHYDKPKVDRAEVKSSARHEWNLAMQFPKYTMGFRVHNRGAYTIRYAYQKKPTTYEELEAGVADFKSFVPRELWLCNEETTADRDVDVYIEYWTPEDETHWPEFLAERFRTVLERFRNLLPWRR